MKLMRPRLPICRLPSASPLGAQTFTKSSPTGKYFVRRVKPDPTSCLPVNEWLPPSLNVIPQRPRQRRSSHRLVYRYDRRAAVAVGRVALERQGGDGTGTFTFRLSSDITGAAALIVPLPRTLGISQTGHVILDATTGVHDLFIAVDSVGASGRLYCVVDDPLPSPRNLQPIPIYPTEALLVHPGAGRDRVSRPHPALPQLTRAESASASGASAPPSAS